MNERLKLLADQKSDVIQWALHNIVFGLAGVWMPFFALLLFGKLRVHESFTDGHLLVFSVTLSAVSLGFYLKETRISLRRAHTMTYAILMVTMICSALALSVLSVANAFTPTVQLDMCMLSTATVILVLVTMACNFTLFVTEVTGARTEIIDEQYNASARKLAEAAKAATVANGVRV